MGEETEQPVGMEPALPQEPAEPASAPIEGDIPSAPQISDSQPTPPIPEQEPPTETQEQSSAPSIEPEQVQPAPQQSVPQAAQQRPIGEIMASLRQQKANKREVRLQKIIGVAREKGRITNNNIQKLLRVSDATATRYAHELINRGLLQKLGSRKATSYQLR